MVGGAWRVFVDRHAHISELIHSALFVEGFGQNGPGGKPVGQRGRRMVVGKIARADFLTNVMEVLHAQAELPEIVATLSSLFLPAASLNDGHKNDEAQCNDGHQRDQLAAREESAAWMGGFIVHGEQTQGARNRQTRRFSTSSVPPFCTARHLFAARRSTAKAASRRGSGSSHKALHSLRWHSRDRP
jgi:hypothetical protein